VQKGFGSRFLDDIINDPSSIVLLCSGRSLPVFPRDMHITFLVVFLHPPHNIALNRHWEVWSMCNVRELRGGAIARHYSLLILF